MTTQSMLLAKQPGDTGVFATATPACLSLYRIDDTTLTAHGRPQLWQRCVPPLQRWLLDTRAGSHPTTPHEERDMNNNNTTMPATTSSVHGGGNGSVGLPTSLSLSADSNLHFFLADQRGAGWIGHLGQDRLARLFASSARLHKAQHQRSATHHDAVYTTTDAVSSTTVTSSSSDDEDNDNNDDDKNNDEEGNEAGETRTGRSSHAGRGHAAIDTLHRVQNLLWGDDASEETALLRLRGVITASGWDPRNGAVLGLGRQDAVVQLLDVEYLVGGAGPTEEMHLEESNIVGGATAASSFAAAAAATATSSHHASYHNNVCSGEEAMPVSGGSFASHHSSNAAATGTMHGLHRSTHSRAAGSVSNASVGQNTVMMTSTLTGREARARGGGRRVKFATTARMQCSIIHERVLDGAVTAMDWIPMSHLTVVATRRQDQMGYSAEIMDLRAPDIHPRYLGAAPGMYGMPYRYDPLMMSSAQAAVMHMQPPPPLQGQAQAQQHSHLYPTLPSSSSRRRCFADVLACEPGQTYIASAGGSQAHVDVVQLWDLRKTTQPVAEQLYGKATYTSLCWCPAARLTVLGTTSSGALRVHDFTQDSTSSEPAYVDRYANEREEHAGHGGLYRSRSGSVEPERTSAWPAPSRTSSLPHTTAGAGGSSSSNVSPALQQQPHRAASNRSSSTPYRHDRTHSEETESVREASTSEAEESSHEQPHGSVHDVQTHNAASLRQRQLRRRPWPAARCALPGRVPAAAVAWLTSDRLTRTSKPSTPQDNKTAADDNTKKEKAAAAEDISHDEENDDDDARHREVVGRGCRTDLPQLLLLSQTDGELYVQVYSRRGSLVTMYDDEVPLVASGPNLFALPQHVSTCISTPCETRAGGAVDRTTRMLSRATQGLCIDPYQNAQLLLREGVDKEGFALFLYGYVVARHLYPLQATSASYVALPARKVLPGMLDLLRVACQPHKTMAATSANTSTAPPPRTKVAASKSEASRHATNNGHVSDEAAGDTTMALRTLFLQALGWLPLTHSNTSSDDESSSSRNNSKTITKRYFVDGDGIGMQDLQEAVERRVCVLILLHEWQSAADLLALYSACHPLYPGIALELSAAEHGGGGQSALRAAVQCQASLGGKRFCWFALALAHLVALTAQAEPRAVHGVAVQDKAETTAAREGKGEEASMAATLSSSSYSSLHLPAGAQPAQGTASVHQSQELLLLGKCNNNNNNSSNSRRPTPATLTGVVSSGGVDSANDAVLQTTATAVCGTSEVVHEAQPSATQGEVHRAAAASLAPLTGQAALRHLYKLLREFPTLPLTDQLGMAVALLLQPLPHTPPSVLEESVRALMTVLRQLVRSQYSVTYSAGGTTHDSASRALRGHVAAGEDSADVIDDDDDAVPGAHGRCSLLLAAAVHGMAEDATMMALQAYVDETADVQLPLCFVTAFGAVRGAGYRAWAAAYGEMLNAGAHYMLRCQHELQLLKASRLRATLALGGAGPLHATAMTNTTNVPALLPSSATSAMGHTSLATLGGNSSHNVSGRMAESTAAANFTNTTTTNSSNNSGSGMMRGRGRAGLPSAALQRGGVSHNITHNAAATPFGLFRAPDPMALAVPSATATAHAGSPLGVRGPGGGPIVVGAGANTVNATAAAAAAAASAAAAANAACAVELRCNCGQAMHATAPVKMVSSNPTVAPHLALTRRTRAPCGNPECQQWQAPMCTVCGERMEHKGMELSPGRSFVWCTVCLHGGHWCHLREWFAKHRKCAVENCPCHCCTGSTL